MSSFVFEGVERQPSLAEKVAHRLLTAIVRGDIATGQRLPSERLLAEQFGVSRTVIREAVRALAGKGVIEARSGSGLWVSNVPAENVRQMLHLYLQGSVRLGEAGGSQAFAKIHEVRQVIEVHVAGRAAEMAGDARVGAVREAHDHMRAVLADTTAAADADVAFHRAIVELTGNDVFGLMLEAISGALFEIRLRTLNVDGQPERALRAHERILEAIEAGDADAARRAMRVHLDELKEVWERSVSEADE